MALDLIRSFYSSPTVKNITVIVAVYGLQAILHKDFFRCPCVSHQFYGLAFLLGPAAFLFGLSLVIYRRSWSVVLTCLKYNDHKIQCNFFLNALVDFFNPFLASVSWIILVLLRGDFYVCIRGGPGQHCASFEEKGNVNFDQLYFQSFILGSACLVAMVIFSTGIVCIQRCCTNDLRLLPTHDDLRHFKKKAILKAFDAKTKQVANEFADKVVESSFALQDSEISVDQQFLIAREKTMDIYEQNVVNDYLIDCPVNHLQSMEFASTSTM